MRTLKNYLIAVVCLSAPSAFAEGESIVDPALMNQGVWAEPIFQSRAEAAVAEQAAASGASRDIASVGASAPVAKDGEALAVKYNKHPDQYLEVLKVIPNSAPALSQAWIEHTVSNED